MKMWIKNKYNLIICYSLRSKKKGMNLVLIEITKNVQNGKTKALKSNKPMKTVKWLHPSFLAIFFFANRSSYF